MVSIYEKNHKNKLWIFHIELLVYMTVAPFFMGIYKITTKWGKKQMGFNGICLFFFATNNIVVTGCKGD